MRGNRRGRWTLLLFRKDDPDSRSFRFDRPALWALLGGSALVLLLLGAVAGALWMAERESDRRAELQADVERLRSEQARVAGLARRLEAMQEDYERIRRALGSEPGPATGTVRLPEPGEGREPRRVETDVEQGLPSAWPLASPGFVTRSFDAPRGSAAAGHPGLDIAVPVGSYVRAAGAGRVVAAGSDSVYGYHVRIAHRDDVSSLYGHNSWLFVAIGDTVERLQVIALSGNTGQSTAPHLHFEVERDGKVVDPLEYVSLAGR